MITHSPSTKIMCDIKLAIREPYSATYTCTIQVNGEVFHPREVVTITLLEMSELRDKFEKLSQRRDITSEQRDIYSQVFLDYSTILERVSGIRQNTPITIYTFDYNPRFFPVPLCEDSLDNLDLYLYKRVEDRVVYIENVYDPDDDLYLALERGRFPNLEMLETCMVDLPFTPPKAIYLRGYLTAYRSVEYHGEVSVTLPRFRPNSPLFSNTPNVVRVDYGHCGCITLKELIPNVDYSTVNKVLLYSTENDTLVAALDEIQKMNNLRELITNPVVLGELIARDIVLTEVKRLTIPDIRLMGGLNWTKIGEVLPNVTEFSYDGKNHMILSPYIEHLEISGTSRVTFDDRVSSFHISKIKPVYNNSAGEELFLPQTTLVPSDRSGRTITCGLDLSTYFSGLPSRLLPVAKFEVIREEE